MHASADMRTDMDLCDWAVMGLERRAVSAWVTYHFDTILVKHALNTDANGLLLCFYCGVYLLDFFCSGIQFNLLLSPYPCFISLLYLHLYVLGDDVLIS